MKKLMVLVLFTIVAAGSVTRASILDKVKHVVTAPVTAPIELVKHPSVENVVKAASPTVAQAAEADKQLGVSKKIETAANLPNEAHDVLNNANQTMGNANQAIGNANRAIGDARNTLGFAQGRLDSLSNTVAELLREMSVPLHAGAYLFCALLLVWLLVGIRRLARGSQPQ
jgi:flagellin-like hook-associated protein FlgL